MAVLTTDIKHFMCHKNNPMMFNQLA